MSKVLVTENNLQDIASAIRSKNQSFDTYRPGDMAAAIRAIPTGGTSTLISKTITQNGEYDPADDNADGYSAVVVNVPTGQINLQSKTVTQNGTVTPDAGYDGLSSVVVNVSGGGGSGILSGTTEPETSQGADGDVYLQYMGMPPGVTIPTDCELLAYIEATGAQWVRTDYAPALNTRLVMECMLLGATNYYTPFGERRNNTSEGFYLLHTGGRWNFMGNSSETRFSNDLPLNARITIEAAYGKATWTGDSGSGQCTPTAGTTANTLPLFLFTLNSNGSDYGTSTHALMRLYRVSIYESDTLVRCYVPIADSNGVACLYETETDTFLYNAGSGTFINGGAPGEVTNAYAKVNGAWQSLIGTNIDDINV